MPFCVNAFPTPLTDGSFFPTFSRAVNWPGKTTTRAANVASPPRDFGLGIDAVAWHALHVLHLALSLDPPTVGK